MTDYIVNNTKANASNTNQSPSAECNVGYQTLYPSLAGAVPYTCLRSGQSTPYRLGSRPNGTFQVA